VVRTRPAGISPVVLAPAPATAAFSTSTADASLTPAIAASANARAAGLVVSSTDRPTVSASIRRRLISSESAAATTASARPGTDAHSVSNASVVATSTPALRSESAVVLVSAATRPAIANRPSGPW